MCLTAIIIILTGVYNDEDSTENHAGLFDI